MYIGADMTIRIAAGAALLVVLGTGTVQAATTHVFDLSRSGDDAVSSSPNSFALDSDVPAEGGGVLTGTFTGRFSDGLALGTANSITGGSFGDAIELDRFFNGAGVCRTGDCTSSRKGVGEPHTADGVTEDIGDIVEMAFTVEDTLVDVTLTRLVFGWIGEWTWNGTELGFADTDGAFEVILDTLDADGDLGIGVGDTLAVSDTVTPNIETRRSRGFFDLTGETLIDSIFGVKAGDGGSWKLLTVTVEFDGGSGPPIADSPPEVPLPAAFWLLLSGIGGTFLIARGKR